MQRHEHANHHGADERHPYQPSHETYAEAQEGSVGSSDRPSDCSSGLRERLVPPVRIRNKCAHDSNEHCVPSVGATL